MERNDLAAHEPEVVANMTATSRSAIDYPAVALDVADYNQKMFKWLVNTSTIASSEPDKLHRYMNGGFNSTAGTQYATWQEAIVTGQGFPRSLTPFLP